MEGWGDGGEEEDEFAYVHYAQTTKRRRLQEQVKEGGGAAAGDTQQQLQQEQEEDSSVSTDAFRGHHCPICLGLVVDSVMIQSCRHLYCKVCLFEVRSWNPSSLRSKI